MPRWIHRLLHNDAEDKRLDAELQFHLEQQIADNITAGMTPEEARRRAQIALGGVEQVKQRTRDVHWENFLENVVRDFRFAVRSLRKDARSSCLGILALALGIGATTVIFSLFQAVLIHPFPYKDADRIVSFSIRNLTSNGGSTGRDFFTAEEFNAFREQNHVFEDMAGYDGNSGMVSNDGFDWENGSALNDGRASHKLLGGTAVTANTFEFYGVPPLLGRAIAAEDGKPGVPPVFVMSYRMWQTEFGGDRGILGKTFVLNGGPSTLIGIMPRQFNIYNANFWMPTSLDRGGPGFGHGSSGIFQLIGRLKPGVSMQTAAADLDVIAHRLTAAEAPSVLTPEHYAIRVHGLVDDEAGSLRPAFYALLAAVFMLLLIACTNVTNLLLARATVCERETAVRAALGASRVRLLSQFLAESFVLSTAACACGWLLAYCGLKILVPMIPPAILPVEAVIRLNSTVLWFAIGIAVLTALLCGLAPAVHALRANLQPQLGGSGKGTAGNFRHGKLRGALVIVEITLSIVLLVGAGLMMRSFLALTHNQLPFEPPKLLYATLRLPHERYYGKPDRKPEFFRQLLPRIESLPGVVSATETWEDPTNDGMWTDVMIPGKPHAERWTTNYELCTVDYFRTLGLELLHGRLLNQQDLDSVRYAAVVNETLARQYFGKEDPLGKQIKFEVFDRPFLDAPHNTYFEIVGVIKDWRTRPVGSQYQVMPMAFLPLSVVNLHFPPSIVVKTAVDPHSMLKSIQQQVWAVDPDVSFIGGETIQQLLEKQFQQPRFQMEILGVFAAVGVVLVVIGVFSVMAYTVSLQTHDIGIRLALGAQQRDILKMVLRKGLTLIAAGIVIGVVASLGLTRFIASQLWGVSPTDPWTFAGVVVGILAVGLAACFLPARRATQVDPVVALRYE